MIIFTDKKVQNFVKLQCVLKDLFTKEKWFLFFCLTVHIKAGQRRLRSDLRLKYFGQVWTNVSRKWWKKPAKVPQPATSTNTIARDSAECQAIANAFLYVAHSMLYSHQRRRLFAISIGAKTLCTLTRPFLKVPVHFTLKSCAPPTPEKNSGRMGDTLIASGPGRREP